MMSSREEIHPGPDVERCGFAAADSGDTDCPFLIKTGRWRQTLLSTAPDRLLMVSIVLIIFAEALWVALHLSMPRMPLLLETTFEIAVLLALLLTVYYGIYRPFWFERQRKEEEIRLLSRQLIRSEEAARKNLARDLHDEFGQVLTALQFGVETICSSLPDDHAHLEIQCGRLSGMIAHLGNHVRNVTAELRPAILDSVGLVSALRWHAREFEKAHAGTKVNVQADDSAGRLPAEAEIALYRVCQESLNNVAKHARASQVTIDLRHTPERLNLSVRDDGIGFDAEPRQETSVCRSGFGILGMRERIADLGGTFDVVSLQRGGTEVRVCIPLAAAGVAG